MSTQAINWRETPFTDREKLMLAIIGVLVLVIGGLFVFGDGYGILRTGERHSYVTNLFTEGISVVVTVVALGLWQAERAREDLKKTLVRRVRSRSNDIVIGAIEELRENDWLTGEDGLLQGEGLTQAQMQGADLISANLEGAVLTEANLSEVALYLANLEGAVLEGANLTGAWLRKANLERAKLNGADLSGVNLRDANLQGVALEGANLTGAWLLEAILPNGETYSDTTDMRKFTDPRHPEYAQTRDQINALRQKAGLPPLE